MRMSWGVLVYRSILIYDFEGWFGAVRWDKMQGMKGTNISPIRPG